MDDASLEGQLMRQMFIGESDSDESFSSSDRNLPYANDANDASHKDIRENTTLIMDDIWIVQDRSRGIAHHLWPAASDLAQFVLNSYDSILDEVEAEEILSEKETQVAPIDLKPKRNVEPSLNFMERRRNNALCTLREFFRSAFLPCGYDLRLRRDNLKYRESHGQILPIMDVLELGAGVGLTGLKVATKLPINLLLTDVESALPQLKKNIALNKNNFYCGKCSANAHRLFWGRDDWNTLSKQISGEKSQNDSEFESKTLDGNLNRSKLKPLLVLAADCVYWEELHLPLEETLAKILQSYEPGHAVCLIAGMRRWKRDNHFYGTLGKRTRTSSHTLECVCINEQVARNVDEKREIMRIYLVRWVKRSC